MKQSLRLTFCFSLCFMGLTLVPFPYSVAQDKAARILQDLGGHAEDIVDFFQANDYSNADSTYVVMLNEFVVLQKISGSSNERERLLASIKTGLSVIHQSIQAKNAMKGALASNELTAKVIQLQSFPDNSARVVAQLDYLGREIVLLNKDGAGKNAGILKTRRADIDTAWQSIRGNILMNAKNAELVRRVDEVVLDVRSTLTAKAQIEAGTKLLDLVDNLEKTVTR